MLHTRYFVFPITGMLALFMCSQASAAISTHADDFESYTISDADAFGTSIVDAVYMVFGNVIGGTGGDYEYGPLKAPNAAAAGVADGFSAIAAGEGDIPQGAQQLSVFNDYQNGDHALPATSIESEFYKEYTIDTANLGETWTLTYDAKLGDLTAPTTAEAFLKVLDPNNGFSETAKVSVDMTSAPGTWNGYVIDLVIDPAWDGQLFQFGFSSTATNYDPSGVFYDNLLLDCTANCGGLTSFTDNFESYGAAPYTNELELAGYVYSNNVFDTGSVFKFNYNGGAPSEGPQMSAITTGEGGVDQGTYQWNTYSDYDCCTAGTEGHGAGEVVEVNLIQEQTPGAADVGTTWQFAFDAKGGNILSAPNTSSTAAAFIKVLDPGAGFSVIDSTSVDLTTTPGTWTGYSLSLTITAPMVGKLLQFGVTNSATNFDNTAVFYDNLDWNPLVGCVGNGTDTDGDGTDDNCDNCAAVANPTQFDADADGFGNRCDADFDNSCLTNGLDLGIFKGAFFTPDPVVDMDESGLVNGLDLGLFKGSFFKAPGPNGADVVDACP